MSDRYKGLVKIAYADAEEKRALLEGWGRFQNAHPVASMAAYMIPGVGTAASGADAIRAFGQGRVMAGIGNTLLAGASLIPGLGLLKGLGRGAQIAAGMRPAYRMAGAGTRGLLQRGTANAMSYVPGASRLAPYGGRMINYANNSARTLQPLYGWKPMAAGVGMTMMGAPDPSMMAPRPNPRPNPYMRQMQSYA